MLQRQVNMRYMIGFICSVCVIGSILLILLNRKSKKTIAMRKIQIIGYGICILLVINTILENVFFKTYIRYYEIFRVVDNILFGILGITVVAGMALNLKEMISRKRKNDDS